MERFFEEGTLTQEELEGGLRTATRNRQMFPLVCTSAQANVGIGPLLDTILSCLPPAADHPLPAADPETGEALGYDAGDGAPSAAFVWKTIADPFAGRITMFRVAAGTLKADSTVHNVTQDGGERFGALAVMQGKTQHPVPELKAGDLGAVAKLKETHTNDTLAEKGSPVRFAPIAFAEPVLSYAIEPKSRGDEEKISGALQRLREEDPTIQYTRDPQTRQLLLSGQGQVHIEVTVAKLKRRFGVGVNLKLPRIPYRETILAATEAHGRHKKQSGGHGQFGDCRIRVEPLSRGEDFAFVDEIFGGSIPRQFIPAVEKGIQEARVKGYLAGYPMVDFKVTLYDGQFHSVDSNEMSFKMAGRLAFRDAMERARPTLLEPVMNVEIYAPSDFAGDLMGDLNGRRGRIGGMEPRGGVDGHQGAGADGGNAHLRAAVDLRHGRQRLVPHGVLALRGGAGAPPREDRGGLEGPRTETRRRASAGSCRGTSGATGRPNRSALPAGVRPSRPTCGRPWAVPCPDRTRCRSAPPGRSRPRRRGGTRRATGACNRPDGWRTGARWCRTASPPPPDPPDRGGPCGGRSRRESCPFRRRAPAWRR